MPDTLASTLWLSLIDFIVVFAVLVLLMLVCYALRLFSRDGSRGTDDHLEPHEHQSVDAAAGDAIAHEDPDTKWWAVVPPARDEAEHTPETEGE
jgi:hypothetical protein